MPRLYRHVALSLSLSALRFVCPRPYAVPQTWRSQSSRSRSLIPNSRAVDEHDMLYRIAHPPLFLLTPPRQCRDPNTSMRMISHPHTVVFSHLYLPARARGLLGFHFSVIVVPPSRLITMVSLFWCWIRNTPPDRVAPPASISLFTRTCHLSSFCFCFCPTPRHPTQTRNQMNIYRCAIPMRRCFPCNSPRGLQLQGLQSMHLSLPACAPARFPGREGGKIG
ncbi:hypothetical protein BKA62DRAFT_48821 [Auriculariales sp. MPI-PUGE-AT-0066]|nr:hypothetical protein BKA62DRAFT_48821 [Auriculariales sp. MPI-PUGE-AT-0066]